MLGSGIWLSCPLVAEVISLYVPFLMAALTGDTGTLHSSILNVPLGTISYGARCLSAYSPNLLEGEFCELPLNGVLGSTYSPGPTPMSGLSHYRCFLPIIPLGGFGPSVVCLAHRGGVMRLFVESVTINITIKRKPAKEREACATPTNRKRHDRGSPVETVESPS
jgi:hypothetical protein